MHLCWQKKSKFNNFFSWFLCAENSFLKKNSTGEGRQLQLIVLNPYMESLCNSAFKNIDEGMFSAPSERSALHTILFLNFRSFQYSFDSDTYVGKFSDIRQRHLLSQRQFWSKYYKNARSRNSCRKRSWLYLLSLGLIRQKMKILMVQTTP